MVKKLNPKLSTLNHKPQTFNHKPSTLHLEPQTVNPKPDLCILGDPQLFALVRCEQAFFSQGSNEFDKLLQSSVEKRCLNP
jgi:hypothetical protein